ncbi:MAG TPA: 2-amino-4-hydroxy-6-hydroxymethyldihydropteridine diphosphokinase [Candidatus Cloacimonadota bacterium]|nr:2-amino-4-hydroxy-6-hydroxymethyldihydropteridine diphosphokinase [Candidatus Cloacimonadota bacterium]HPS38188.1 2-amino-4-hydroxy-6-hydroxymethyldihydropteridine diphosphokinase [Candidatus Cloacimonadota bacterium]
MRGYLCLGSNQGDSEALIAKAESMIDALPGCGVVERSGVILNKAYGFTDQPDFINQVLAIETELEAHELLRQLLMIETKLGRKREQKWGPRLIDIDILLLGDLVITDTELCLPHPDFHNREFALRLLIELEPELLHPTIKKTVTELYQELEQGGI